MRETDYFKNDSGSGNYTNNQIDIRFALLRKFMDILLISN